MDALFSKIVNIIDSGQNAALSGLDGSCKAYFLAQLAGRLDRKIVYVAGEEDQAYDMARLLRGILGSESVWVLPARDYLSRGQGMSSKPNIERMSFFSEIAANPKRSGVIVMSAPALLFETVPISQFKEYDVTIKIGDQVDIDKLLPRLVTMGYVRYPMVEAPGQFAVRGGIIDIYPADAKDPVRIEFFGNDVDSMRSFSAESQRSLKAIKTLSVRPASEDIGQTGRAWDYILPEWPVWIDEPHKLRESWVLHTKRYRSFLSHAGKEVPALKTYSLEDFEIYLRSKARVYHSFFPQTISGVPFETVEHVAQRESEPFWARPGALAEKILEWQSKNWKIIIAVPEKNRLERIKTELLGQGAGATVEFARWHLDKGFISSTLNTALVSERDIAGKKTSKSDSKKRPGSRITADELAVGDFVVHENHGIGVFRGVQRMEVDGIRREYLLIQYAGTDKLYLPLDKLDLLSRYSGGEGREPKLSKLGGSDWERTKKRVQESIQEMAGELLALYAAREKVQGFAFSPDTPWQKQFEEEFEYEETPDQAKAIIDVKRDMEKARPMDRLVCGDVGYGKTEVAMRAAFKAIMDHKQVAVLVPTTVLAEQHFNTFKKRLEAYPAVIEALSRFRTVSQQKRILEDVRKGAVDIIIGTHRLLSKDVHFKDLGLLIIDEEHRFGVRQKERIKSLRETVDVISLSATPIPRTLHMALTGLRDLSVIETPPPERYPINTYVMDHNPEIIREAITAELERDGQVFYVHNRINDIDVVRVELADLIPGVQIDVGHGRMNEEELSAVMKRFMNGESKVLLCTTIIESGLDMPNVNTLIVDEADRMGLAQLYQIRGRVGRSRRVAYAYLTFKPDKVVTETAQKRLNAIREFTELGSGLKIAMRDLEIRGAGNILGPEQHGYIEAVGFDLYCRLLEEETAKSRGEESKLRREMPQLDIKVDSYIPDNYIEDPVLKIQVYRQAMLAESIEEIVEIEKELVDRFGPLPQPTINLLRISKLRLKARDKEIKNLNTDAKRIELTLDRPLGEKFKELTMLQDKYKFNISVTNQNTLVLKSFKGLSLDALEDLLEVI
ncbi:MAG: transcription-repair coupling factor [Candidatus Saccharibacteria bacterium]